MTDFLSTYGSEPLDGKYRLLERLGAGGMGEVYKADHVFLNALRVIKIVRPQISSSPEAHDRFLREARLATKVHHQNVATLHDFASLPDGSHYMVWEFIDGENIAQLLRRRGPLPPRQAIRLTIEALAGLEAVHRAGIVHRDISPENLMVTRESDGSEHVKIIDLGVAKADETEPGMTRTGMFVGKLRYASPEHLGFVPEGERIDGRADLYSLAIVLYEMLTGRAPFEATSPHQYYIRYSRAETLAPLDLSAVPGGAELQGVLAHALEQNRNKRFANAREFADALQRAAQSIPASDTETAFLPPDDATMRIGGGASAFASTLRSDYGTAATAKTLSSTPLPVIPPQPTPPPVQQTPAPAPAPAPVPPPVAAAPTVIDRAPGPRKKSSAAVPVTIAVILLLAMVGLAGYIGFKMIGGGGFALKPKLNTTDTTASATTTASTASTAPPATTSSAPAPATASSAPASTVVEVGAAATTSSAPARTTTTTQAPAQTASAEPPLTKKERRQRQQQAQVVPPASEQPQQAETDQPEEQPAPQQHRREESAPAGLKTYYDGTGDKSGNDQAVSYARRQLAGVHQVALSGSGDPELRNQLEQLLRRNGIQVSDNADTTIRFYGKLERHSLGRKNRFADAEIRRNGRLVFHYQLPREDYRTGDNPAEAFARVAADLFH